MKKVLLPLVALITLASCSNYGKKVKIEGTKAEIYYKGEGVNEEDAKKTGEFLKKYFIPEDKEASMQLTRDGDAYTIRLVYQKDVYDTLKGADDEFKLLAARASKDLFGGKKVHIALANNRFKDFKTIAFDADVAKRLNNPDPVNPDPVNPDPVNPNGPTLSKTDFDHHAVGDVDFYWRGISDEEAKTIADYIVADGSFSGGTAELYMQKKNDRYIISFPMIESARNNPTYHAEVDRVSKKIKDNVFPNTPFTFYITDERLAAVKAFEY